MSERYTRAEVFGILDNEGTEYAIREGYVSVDNIPLDTPANVVAAVEEIACTRKVVRLVDDWFDYEPCEL
jgi:hypothetical protein